METSISGVGKPIQKDSTIIAREILNLEKKYWMAMKDHDLDAAIALTDFPCLVAGAHGISSVNKQQFTEMFESHEEAAKLFISHPHFKIFPGESVEIMECLPMPTK